MSWSERDTCPLEERVLDETLLAGRMSFTASEHLASCASCRGAIRDVLSLALAPPTDEENDVIDRVLEGRDWSAWVRGALEAKTTSEVGAAESDATGEDARAARGSRRLRLVRG